MDMPIRIQRSFFYFKLNVIVEIRLLAKFDYCTIWLIIKNDIYFYLSIYLSIFLYVLTPEGDIRRVPVNQVLGVSFFFVYFFCAM